MVLNQKSSYIRVLDGDKSDNIPGCIWDVE